MTNEWVTVCKTLPVKELDQLAFLSTEIFFYEQMQETWSRVQAATISNFQRRIVQNEKKRWTVIQRDKEDWL